MLKQKKSLCIFIHFSEQQHIPYYVGIFVNELAKFFDEVVLLSNNKTLKSTPNLSSNVSIKFQKNEGYDFGRFYNYYKTINKDDYYRLACINESNILINKLDNILNWDSIIHFDFYGLVDSYERPWFSKSLNTYHIQSHFLVLHKNAIDLLDDYFHTVNFDELFHEKNPKALRCKVIEKWEIGLSQFMKSKGLIIGHYIDCKELTQKCNIRMDSNISHILYKELLMSGYPFLKKKVIFDQKMGFWKSPPIWKDLIKKYGNAEWNLDILIEELNQMKNEYQERKRP